MPVNTKNLILGAGHLYYGRADALSTALPTPAAGQSFKQALDAATVYNATTNPNPPWFYAGATTDGVEVAYEPDYTDIEVDQVKAAVMMFNTGLTVSVGTNLAEATLNNLLIAWGQQDNRLTTNADGQVLNIADLKDNPTERVIALVGNGPRGLADAAGEVVERVYFGRRAVSVEGSTHSLQKADATVFPVTFRLLPATASVGSEYGYITDRVYVPA